MGECPNRVYMFFLFLHEGLGMAPGGVGCLKWRHWGFGIHQRWGRKMVVFSYPVIIVHN